MHLRREDVDSRQRETDAILKILTHVKRSQISETRPATVQAHGQNHGGDY